jgi:hypothetical protein
MPLSARQLKEAWMKDRTLQKLRLALYKLLLAMECTGDLAHSGAANVFPGAWPMIARSASARLARARRLCQEAMAAPFLGDDKKALDAMRGSIEELGHAYERIESGARNKVLGRVLSRTVGRVKAQSLLWETRRVSMPPSAQG